MLDKKTEMKDLMAKGYDKEIDLYCKDITSHYACKASPHSQLLDHKILDNLQIFLLCTCHNKVAQTVSPPTHCQLLFKRIMQGMLMTTCT